MTRPKKNNIYEVQNKEKYIGTHNPRYLSSWELQVFQRFDLNPNVIRWGSETTRIPYYSNADAKMRIYMVDLFVEFLNTQGEVVKELIEIKPYSQTQPPKKTSRKTLQTYTKELYTYQVNRDKWMAAIDFCKKRGMRFRILTEKHPTKKKARIFR